MGSWLDLLGHVGLDLVTDHDSVANRAPTARLYAAAWLYIEPYVSGEPYRQRTCGAALRLLLDTIAADPYPLSPRIRRLRSALGKLDPSSVAQEQSRLPG